MEKVFYDWNIINNGILKLSNQLTDKEIKFITGVPRGGLVPAVMLSHITDIPYLSLETISVLKDTPLESVLVVDDICDSGKTLVKYKKLGFLTASIDKKNEAVFSPNFFAYIVACDDYIVYPWENLIN